MTEQEREKINNYIKEYSKLSYVFSERIKKEIFGVSIRMDIMKYQSEERYTEKARVLLQKGEMRYECEFVDKHSWEDSFCPLELNGVRYLCFRKTLYGFSLLNADTFEEEEFFPFNVLKGEESYIFVNAIAFHEFVVFDGCYWGTPYFYYIYDSKTKKFLNIYQEYGITSIDSGMCISEARLILAGKKEETKEMIAFSREELKRLVQEKGKNDF